MKLTTILTIASLLTTTVIGGPAPHIICNDGFLPNKLCLSDCKSNGVYVPSLGADLITSISLPSLALTLDTAHPSYALATSTNVKVALGIPTWLGFLGSNFVGAGAVIGVGQVGKETVGTLVSNDYGKASGTISEGAVTLDLVDSKLTVDNAAGFSEFLKSTLLTTGVAPLRLKGYANTKADILKDPFNSFTCLRYVGFDLEATSLRGLGGLKNTVISGLPTVKSGKPGRGIELAIPLTIDNPSNVALNIKGTDVELDLVFEDTVLGKVVLPALSLKQGVNAVNATAFVNPTTVAAAGKARKLFSQFTGNVKSRVAVARGRAVGLSVLDAALGALTIPQVLPANERNLINSARADGNTIEYIDDSGFRISLSTTITAYNPFDVPVTISRLKANLNYKNTNCVSADSVLENFVIPPKTEKVSPSFKIIIDAEGKDVCNEFVNEQLVGETSVLDVVSVLEVAVDAFGTGIDYVQNGVPVVTRFD